MTMILQTKQRKLAVYVHNETQTYPCFMLPWRVTHRVFSYILRWLGVLTHCICKTHQYNQDKLTHLSN